MTDMLERAARAIDADNKKQRLGDNASNMDICRDQTRAVLEAIREPTEEMVHAVAAYDNQDLIVRRAWQVMIDFILGTAGRASDG